MQLQWSPVMVTATNKLFNKGGQWMGGTASQLWSELSRSPAAAAGLGWCPGLDQPELFCSAARLSCYVFYSTFLKVSFNCSMGKRSWLHWVGDLNLHPVSRLHVGTPGTGSGVCPTPWTQVTSVQRDAPVGGDPPCCSVMAGGDVWGPGISHRHDGKVVKHERATLGCLPCVKQAHLLPRASCHSVSTELCIATFHDELSGALQGVAQAGTPHSPNDPFSQPVFLSRSEK